LILPLGFEDSNFAYKFLEILTREVFPTQFETEESALDGAGTLEFKFALAEAKLFKKSPDYIA
tara:strand:- start:1230 stop:1418 length:189 start_codon:yes stop_codon:yes gene_type:complete